MTAARPGKMSLLEIVQNILSATGGDEVNSIGDTIEAYDVAVEVQTTFYELIGGMEAPYRSNVFQLEAVSDVTRPTHMKIPAGVKDIDELYFDYQTGAKTSWTRLTYLEPTEFVKRSMQVANDAAAAASSDFSGVPIYVLSDRDPRYFTSFDDQHIVFDSYDASKMSTLTEVRTLGMGTIMPSFSLEDAFIPSLPADMFPLLLSEAKQACFINLKQVSNAKEDQRSRRQRVRRMNNQRRSKPGSKNQVSFGRKSAI